MSSPVESWKDMENGELNDRLSDVTYSTCLTYIHSLIHFWHAPIGVHITQRTHQSPEWTFLRHVNCFIQGEVVGFQVLLDSTRASWWPPPVFHLLDSIS